MELLGANAKRRRSKGLAACESPPRTTEATEAPNPTPTTDGKERPPLLVPPPDAGGGGGGGGGDGDAVDRISGLPDAVLGEILSLLPTKEAGRTQILTSRWRHVWVTSPLVLDGAGLYNKPKALLGDSSDDDDYESSDSDEDEKALTATYEVLASAVTHILSAHPGPVRRFCIPSLYLHDRRTTVDAWLSSPALDNLQELEFYHKTYDMIWYILPSSQLAQPPASTFRFSATLRVATLGKCELLDSSVEGIHFPQLKQLGLEEVSISEGSLHTIISSSPVLDCLLLKDIFGLGRVRISSSSLRSIGVGAGRHRDNLQLLQEVIVVDAPCLERFLFLGKPMNLTVLSAPKLETLGCLQDDGFDHPRIVIGTTAIQGLNIASLTMALSNVKILAVRSRRHINLDTVIELLKCFPCLEKLYIKSSISGQMNRWRRKHRDFIKSFDIRLKTIVLKEYRGTRSQVNFASLFVLNARELESMRLGVEFTDYNEAFFTKQHGMLQMQSRASRGARIHFAIEACTCCVHVNHVRDLSIADPFECRC